MFIPHYRLVRDTNDGCGEYQCLFCGHTWEWRGGSAPVRFCMFCGTEYAPQGRLDCRDQGTPRWQYELQKKHGEERIYLWEQTWRREHKPQPCWIVEERCIWLKDGKDDHVQRDWKFKTRLRFYPNIMTAHEAFQELLRLRDEEAKRGTPADPDYDPDIDDDSFGYNYRNEFRLRRETA